LIKFVTGAVCYAYSERIKGARHNLDVGHERACQLGLQT
jgi:hypothetical protein